MNKLIFVTSKYPFNSCETFIENEISYLAKSFDKVYIYATEANKKEPCRKVPENVVVFPANPKKIAKKDYLPELFKKENLSEILKNCLSGNVFGKVSACCHFSACVSASLKRMPEFIKMCDLKSDDKICVYSYWLSTVGMCAVYINEAVKKSGYSTKFVARCHRFDIYAERNYCDYLPFQEKMVSKFEFIYPCSDHGTKYLKNIFPSYSSKIITKYLGINDRFLKKFPEKNNELKVVSCSNVAPVKRVNLIIEALSKIENKKIHWTHIGSGVDIREIKAFAESKLKDNITFTFLGRIPNIEIYNFFNNENTNLFINVSSSEGLPVSIMEATSFGIPIIATDVGGSGEIVIDNYNGFLLEENFNIDDLTRKIIDFYDMPEDKYSEFCHNSRLLFERNFMADNNYNNFFK